MGKRKIKTEEDEAVVVCTECLSTTRLDVKMMRNAFPGESTVARVWCTRCHRFTEKTIKLRGKDSLKVIGNE